MKMEFHSTRLIDLCPAGKGFAAMLAQKTTFGIQISTPLFFCDAHVLFDPNSLRCVKGKKRSPTWNESENYSRQEKANGNLIVEMREKKKGKANHS